MDEVVRASAGETFQVTLPGNATTGFRWEFTPAPQNVSMVDLVSATYEASTTSAGAPGLHRFEFLALRAGRTELRFAYRRSWETKEPREQKTIVVEIAGN